MNILMICGSFRQGSLNQALLDAARESLAEHTVEQATIHTLPFYETLLDGDNRPPVVRTFMAMVERADAIIIASPEFNHSVPGVLKNSIDWASRPAFRSPLAGKPVTVLVATPSEHGGCLGEAHLKQIMDSSLCPIYPSMRYCLGSADRKIAAGKLVDAEALRRLDRHVSGFAEWAAAIRRL